MKFLRHVSRFSLRSFFAILVSAGLVVGWISQHVGATLRESAAVAELSETVGPVQDVRGQLFVAS